MDGSLSVAIGSFIGYLIVFGLYSWFKSRGKKKDNDVQGLNEGLCYHKA